MKSNFLAPLMVAAAGAALFLAAPVAQAGNYERVPPPRLDVSNGAKVETAIFAGGCFWGVEAVFERVNGVKSAVSGFSGGTEINPTYRQVVAGRTGHAESVRVIFDPRVVSYAELLQIYFSVVADPTQLNRQGPDVGRHYRTAFFPLTTDQEKVARAYIRQLSSAGVFDKPIVTKIEPYRGFSVAEEYHQDFMVKNPRHPYIIQHDAPKVRALERLFPGKVS